MLNWYRRWKEIRAAKIVDCSHMKKMPERSRLHLVFTILYAIAMVAVLWQHCHPVITIHLICFPIIFGKLFQSILIEAEQLIFQIKVRIVEFFLEFFCNLLMYFSSDLEMGNTVQSFVFDNSKEKRFQSKLFHKTTAVFP